MPEPITETALTPDCNERTIHATATRGRKDNIIRNNNPQILLSVYSACDGQILRSVCTADEPQKSSCQYVTAKSSCQYVQLLYGGQCTGTDVSVYRHGRIDVSVYRHGRVGVQLYGGQAAKSCRCTVTGV